MNVQLRFVRPSPGIAVVDAEAPQQGWICLDLPRTLGGVSRSYGWTIGAMSARIQLPDRALGGGCWRAFSPRPADGLSPIRADNDAEPPASVAASRASEPAFAPVRKPRRIPESDIVFVGRKPRKAGPARRTALDQRRQSSREQPAISHQQPAAESQLSAFDLKRIRAALRAASPRKRAVVQLPRWAAVVAAVAMIGVSFYCGMLWKRGLAIDAPATQHHDNAIG